MLRQLITASILQTIFNNDIKLNTGLCFKSVHRQKHKACSRRLWRIYRPRIKLLLYRRFVTALTDKPTAGLWLYSIFEFQRGIGNLVGGPVSGILAKNVHTAAKYENLFFLSALHF